MNPLLSIYLIGCGVVMIYCGWVIARDVNVSTPRRWRRLGYTVTAGDAVPVLIIMALLWPLLVTLFLFCIIPPRRKK